MKNLPIDSVFANWVNFILEMTVINCSRDSNSFKGISFFSLKFES